VPFIICGKYGHKAGTCRDIKLFDKVPIFYHVRVFSPKEMKSAARYASLYTIFILELQQSVDLNPMVKISLVHEEILNTKQEDIPSNFVL